MEIDKSCCDVKITKELANELISLLDWTKKIEDVEDDLKIDRTILIKLFDKIIHSTKLRDEKIEKASDFFKKLLEWEKLSKDKTDFLLTIFDNEELVENLSDMFKEIYWEEDYKEKWKILCGNIRRRLKNLIEN